MDQTPRPFTFGGASTQPAFGISSSPSAASSGAGSSSGFSTPLAFGSSTGSGLFGRPTTPGQATGNVVESGFPSPSGATNASPSNPFSVASTNSPQSFGGFPNLVPAARSTPDFGTASLFPPALQVPASGGFSFGGGLAAQPLQATQPAALTFGTAKPLESSANQPVNLSFGGGLGAKSSEALTFGTPKPLGSTINQPVNLSFGIKSPPSGQAPAITFGSGATGGGASAATSTGFTATTSPLLTFGVKPNQAGLLGPGPIKDVKQQGPFAFGTAAKAFGSLAALNEMESAQEKRTEAAVVKTISIGGKSEENESEKERKRLEREKRFGKQALAEVPAPAASARPASGREAELELDLPSMRHGPIMGTCQDMCHKEERDRRARDKQLDVFERLDGDPERTSADLCVRKFSRNISESGRAEPEHMRPVPVLRRTMDYLLSLADIPYDERLLEVYRFLWDRTRGIRQDLSVQDIKNAASIQMHEEMIRFHILGAHELCDQKATPDNFDGFNPQQNIEQTAKALTSLFDMYNTHAREGVFFDTEPEFRAYYLLLILETHAEHFKVEQGQTNQFLRGLRPEILRSSDVHFAIRVRRTRELRNHVKYFRLLEEATYLQACLMHIYFGIVRGEALDTIKRVHRQPGDAITTEELQNNLGMDGDEVGPFLEHYGLSLVTIPSGQMALRLSREERFEPQPKPPAARHSSIVAAKRAEKVIQDVLLSGTQVSSPPSRRRPPTPLSMGVPAYTASRPPLSPPKSARASPRFQEAPPGPSAGMPQQPARPLNVQGSQADEVEAQKALEVRQAEERRVAEMERLREEVAEKEAERRARARAEERKRQLEVEERRKREEAERRKREAEERRMWEGEQARLRKEAERKRVEEAAKRKAALEEKKHRQKGALQRLVVFLCKKSAEEREQERIEEEQRARAERAERALASVSARNIAKPSEEVARLYEAAAKEQWLLSSTLFELERVQAEIAAQREARWSPLGDDMVSATASGLQTHSADARCLAFKMVVSTGLDLTSAQEQDAEVLIQQGDRTAEKVDEKYALMYTTEGGDKARRVGGSAERPSVFERLGKRAEKAAGQKEEEGIVARNDLGGADVESGLWLRSKLELQISNEVGSDRQNVGELKLGEDVFEVSKQSHEPIRRQYLWLSVLDSQERNAAGSSALVFLMRAASAGDVNILRKDRLRIKRLVDALPEGAGVPLLVVVAASRSQWVETDSERQPLMETSEDINGPGNEVEMEDPDSPGKEHWTGIELVSVSGGREEAGDMEAEFMEEDGINLKAEYMDEEEMEWDLDEAMDGAQTAVGLALGLDRLGVDDGRIADWRAIFVREEGEASATNQLLLRGLRWLALTSSPQPLFKALTLSDLVQAFLSPPLKGMGPAQCIAAFNDALENSESALNKALVEAPPDWPPPDVEIYEGRRKWALQNLPRVSWSWRPGPSDAAIRRLREARLPNLGGGLDRVKVEEVSRVQSIVNTLLAKIVGGGEKDAAVVKQGTRLLERGQVEYDLEGGVWYRPDWGTIFQEIFQLRLSSLHDIPLSPVYVKPTDLPPEEPPSSPLEEEQGHIHYVEPPGSFLPTTLDGPAAQGALSSKEVTEEDFHADLAFYGELENGPTDDFGRPEEESRPFLSPDDVPELDAAEAFGSVLNGRAFNQAEFELQQQTEAFASGQLGAPLVIADPIQEGRIFVAQNVPRGPIRGSLVQPRRLQRVFSGVAHESGMTEGRDVIMTSPIVGLVQEQAGLIGVRPSSKGDAAADGPLGSGHRLQNGVELMERRPIGASYVAAAGDTSREAAKFVGGSGSGTTGAKRSPLKRKGLLGKDEQHKKTKLELDAKLEALRVYAESTVQEAVETAAGIAEALQGPHRRMSSLGVPFVVDGGRDGKRPREELSGSKDHLLGTIQSGLGARQEDNSGGGQSGLAGNVDANISPEQRFSAAVVRLEAALQSELSASRSSYTSRHASQDVCEPSEEEPCQTRGMAGILKGGIDEGQGNAQAIFEEVTRRTLEVLGSCASSQGAGSMPRWEGSPPLRAQ